MVRHAITLNKNYLRNLEEKLEVVKYDEKHGHNAATAKHYDIDESIIRYWSKQKLVLAAMPGKKGTRLSSPSYPEIENRLYELILKAWNEISADTIINGFVKAGIMEKTNTIEIAAEGELVTEDVASDTETLPDELMDVID